MGLRSPQEIIKTSSIKSAFRSHRKKKEKPFEDNGLNSSFSLGSLPPRSILKTAYTAPGAPATTPLPLLVLDSNFKFSAVDRWKGLGVTSGVASAKWFPTAHPAPNRSSFRAQWNYLTAFVIPFAWIFSIKWCEIKIRSQPQWPRILKQNTNTLMLYYSLFSVLYVKRL